MRHYIFTKEGVMEELGLKNIREVTRYSKNARAKGLVPSKIVGGVEMYDIDILQNKMPELTHYEMGYTESQIETFQNGKLL